MLVTHSGTRPRACLPRRGIQAADGLKEEHSRYSDAPDAATARIPSLSPIVVAARHTTGDITIDGNMVGGARGQNSSTSLFAWRACRMGVGAGAGWAAGALPTTEQSESWALPPCPAISGAVARTYEQLTEAASGIRTKVVRGKRA